MTLKKWLLIPALLYTLSPAEEGISYIRCKVKPDKKTQVEKVECATKMTGVEYERNVKERDSKTLTYKFKGELKNGYIFRSSIETNYKTGVRVVILEDDKLKKNQMYLEAECPSKGKCTISSPFSSLGELETELINNTVYNVIYDGASKNRKSFKIKCSISEN